jgi:hypothetical protein
MIPRTMGDADDDELDPLPGDLARLRSDANRLALVLARVADTVTIWCGELDYPVRALRDAIEGRQPRGHGTWLGEVHVDFVVVVQRGVVPAGQLEELHNAVRAIERLSLLGGATEAAVAAALAEAVRG